MGCLALPPFPPVPSLPPGFTLVPFAPPFIPGVGLCCKLSLPQFPTPAIPISLPAAAINALVTVFTSELALIQAVFDAVVPPCPKF